MTRINEKDEMVTIWPTLDGGTTDGRSDAGLIALLKSATDQELNEAATRRIISKRDIIRSFGAMVRECRRMRKLTQEQLAAATGISKSTIANIETGMLSEGPRIGTLSDLLFVMNHELKPMATRRRFLHSINQTQNGECVGNDAVTPRSGASASCDSVSSINGDCCPYRPESDENSEFGRGPCIR